MNTSRRTALKVVGTSAMLVAGVSVQDAQAATRSGGRRSASPRPVTQRAGRGAASAYLTRVPVRFTEPSVRLELRAQNPGAVTSVPLQDRPARTLNLRNLPILMSIVNEGNTTLPVGTRLLIRTRAQDSATGLLLSPEASLVVSGGQAVVAGAGGAGPSVLVPPVDVLNLQALGRGELNGAVGAGGENVLELRAAIPAGHRLEVRLRYAVASGVSASRLRGVHCSASLDMVAAGLSRGFHEVQSSGVVAALA